MVRCYYNEVEELNCKWEGEFRSLPEHLISNHECLTHTSCKHQKLIMELLLEEELFGFRIVVLNFEKTFCVFEEFFDEETQVLSVLLRCDQQLRYKLKVQEKSACLEYEGYTQTFADPPVEDNSNCLQVTSKQLKQFSYKVDNETRYKVVLALLNS